MNFPTSPRHQELSTLELTQDTTTLIPIASDLSSEGDFFPQGGESVPTFDPYHPKFKRTWGGVTVSHDPHLNNDGEALCRFCFTTLSTPPVLLLWCHGSHVESHEKDVDGKSRTEYDHIIDFDFGIDISQVINSPPFLWTIADELPAFRGKMTKEVYTAEGHRSPTLREMAQARAWKSSRLRRGSPPWILDSLQQHEDLPPGMAILQSSKTFKEWADDYCASRKTLKEFNFEKCVYGWNLQYLEEQVSNLIRSTGYRHELVVSTKLSDTRVQVKPTGLSEVMTNLFYRVILCVFLVYPALLIYRQITCAKWKVCGAAYPLKAWLHLLDSVPGETPEQYLARTGQQCQLSKLKATPNGLSILVGAKEGEWFAAWEDTIRRAVVGGLRSRTALTAPDYAALDGYPD